MMQEMPKDNTSNEGPTAEMSDAISLTKAFHRLGQILPDEQKLEVIPPETLVKDALNLMAEHGFSQLPVGVQGHIVGLFSYRSFSRKVVELGQELIKQKQLPGDLEVEECLEKPVFAHIGTEFSSLFDAMDTEDVILIGQPERLQGILTAIDILRYLYGVASPFVLIAETELGLRGLILRSVDKSELRACCDQSLKYYAEDKRPYRLEDMTFSDYVTIVGDGRNWPHFKPVFRGDRVRTRAKLEEVGRLRNDVFHFRREITTEEYERLTDLRDWMLRKAIAVESSEKGGAS